jgi:hypothetical protein
MQSTNAHLGTERRSKWAPPVVFLFLIGLVVPIQIYVGPLRLSPYRVVLLVLFIPCLVILMSGKVGRIRLSDVLFMLSALWAATALIVVHGFGALETAGIHLIESAGSYLIARCYVRDKKDFVASAQLLFFIILALLPFAALEALTGRSLPLALLSYIGPAIPDTSMGGRFGLERAQVLFEHPILFGVFCSSALGLSWYVLGYGRSNVARIVRAGIVVLATFLSLSAGALAGLIIQTGLIGWELITRGIRARWRILSLACVVTYFAIDFLSNRTPFHVIVTYLTFSPATGYNRILIWQYGSAEVWRHPIFGIGLGDWVRPSWMSSSMDNFWLVVAVRYGLPAFILFAGAVVLTVIALATAKKSDAELASYRTGLLITLGGLAIAGGTVHFWNATYCLFLFLLGSGAWMLDQKPRTRIAVTRQRVSEQPGDLQKNGLVGRPAAWLKSDRR